MSPNFQRYLSGLWLPALAIALFATAIFCRPLLPIDETRYMGVAWEMSLNNGWLSPLTKNFEPYHHKPPLLFWLINLSWSIFGINRWAGTLPVIVASLLCVYLTGLLGKKLPSPLNQTQRIWMIMAASLPFLVYGTLVLFDFLLCVFVLLSLICVVRYCQTRDWRYALYLGVALGFGVLAKGPVAFLYVLPVYLLAPFWSESFEHKKSWYLSLLGIILISAIPVLFWLIPVLMASDNHFAFWLLWNQTAGRVTGNFGESHVRPVYFYLPLLPLFLSPWILFPSFWTALKSIKTSFKTNMTLRFLACWFVPVFVAFSFISGKQPHYMVPLVPAMVLFLSIGLEKVATRRLAQVVAVMATLLIGGQVIAKHALFDKYDLSPVVAELEKVPNAPLAYVSNYHAEFSFLARRTKAVDDISLKELPTWFKKNPDGLAVIRFMQLDDIQPYHKILTMEYRGRHLALVSQRAEVIK